MSTHTIVGTYGDHLAAQKVIEQLTNEGFTRSNIHLASTSSSDSGYKGTENIHGHEHSEDWGDKISNFFRSIFGGNDSEDEGYYAEAVRRGSAVVTVDADSDEEAQRATEIMNRQGAVDVHEQAEQWKQEGWTGFDRSSRPLSADENAAARSTRRNETATGDNLTGRSADRTATATDRASGSDRSAGRETVIPVVKEELQIGKRTAEKGGVRVYSRMVETPVQETVELREERAKVERRPVDRPATDADVSGFKDAEIEVRETVEEAVVGKRARVVEEVVVGTESTSRRQTVNETVRETQVNVEQAGGRQQSASMGDSDADYRQHWQTNYGNLGGNYESYAPAYSYGAELRRDQRYENRDWSEIEPQVRKDWDSRYPKSAWEKFKDSIRYGWDKATHRHDERSMA